MNKENLNDNQMKYLIKLIKHIYKVTNFLMNKVSMV